MHHQNAVVAAAAAEYYEQQLKMQQQKNIEIEKQLRCDLEQIKDLKVSLTLFYLFVHFFHFRIFETIN